MRALNAFLVLIATIVVILLIVRLPPPSPEMTEAEVAQMEAEARQAIADQCAGTPRQSVFRVETPQISSTTTLPNGKIRKTGCGGSADSLPEQRMLPLKADPIRQPDPLPHLEAI